MKETQEMYFIKMKARTFITINNEFFHNQYLSIACLYLTRLTSKLIFCFVFLLPGSLLHSRPWLCQLRSEHGRPWTRRDIGCSSAAKSKNNFKQGCKVRITDLKKWRFVLRNLGFDSNRDYESQSLKRFNSMCDYQSLRFSKKRGATMLMFFTKNYQIFAT